MKIFITGGTGFIGAELVPHLIGKGHEVVLLARPREGLLSFSLNAKGVSGDSSQEGAWQEEVAQCDAAINMAGQPIFGRWDEETKRKILESRIKTTRNLVNAIPRGKPFRLVSTSAVGCYGDAGERILDEQAPYGNDFLSTVAAAWEAQALGAKELGAKVAIARFAIVLARNGGALSQLEKITKWCLGGPLGGGRQSVSWIHRTDLVRALSFLVEHPEIVGPVNLSAPTPLRQKELARALGKKLMRPAITPAPAFAIRALLGEFADTVLFSQRMDSSKLRREGFRFEYPDIAAALEELYGS